MTELRQRMQDAMVQRGFAQRTQETYIGAIWRMAKDPNHPSERMRQAIDSPKGRQLYSQRIGTVEPVFANIRHNKHLTRLNHRGRAKVNTQWNLYCMVHNIEKLAKNGYAQ